jgi:hypothetical protein
MNAHDVIESYVRDVARHLPRRKRDDVAFELRALLHEELAAKAEAEGRAPDKVMAMDLLKGFGRPAEAAGRYHPQIALIDPSDTHSFLIWWIGGAVVVSILNPQNGFAHVTWVGVVFWFFVVIGWARRRQPAGQFLWLPRRVTRPDSLHPALALLGMLGTLVFPFFMYLAPRTFAETAFLGAIPTGGLELTEAFRDSWQRAVTLALLAFVVWLYAAIAWQRGWRRWTRWAGVGAYVALGLMFVLHAAPLWIVPGGETFTIFESPRANATAMPIFGLVGAITILSALYEAWREWSRIRPAPALDAAHTA